MPKKSVPRKNITPIIVDIKKPDFNYERLKKFEKLNLTHIPRVAAPKFLVFKRAVLALLFIGLISISVFLIVVLTNLKTIKANVTETGNQIISNFTSSASALKNFESDTAVGLLKENNQSLDNINNLIQKGGGQSFLDVVGNVVPIVKNTFGFLGQVTKLNITFLELAQNVQELETNGFKYFQTSGQNLVALLQNIHGLIQKVNGQTQDIKNNTSNLKNLSSFFSKIDQDIGNQYLKYSSELYNWDNILVSFSELLASPTDRHFLIFFQNPSEIRPGGGFVGSYADITVNGGQMKQMDVRDIYDPDGQLDLKIVPPKQLQTVTPDWGARDANWFFNFPTSAETIINFMEASKMYSEKKVIFEGAIALNINVVKTLLGITGPIDLPEYKLTMDQNNLLYEIQRSVEAGEDKKAGQPKKILKTLAPLLLEKLNGLSPAVQKNLFDRIKNHLTKKDIMFYAKDQNLSGFLATSDLDGSVFNLPNNFWGSYLAVVNANVAGGKSDAFVDEKVSANVDVDTSGNTFTNLSVTRTHNGNLEKDSWWKAPNKNFIQIFTEPGAALVSISGNDAKPKYQTPDYQNSNYAVNPALAAIEKNEIFVSNYKTWVRKESGKNVFATWLMLPAGETKALNMRYQSSYNNPVLVASDQIYTFVFEKQAGVKNKLEVKINAPFRYYWAESGSAVFSYASDDPDKRIILTLTLKKQQSEN